MTLLAAGKKVAGVSLVRTIAHGSAYPGLDHVGERIARGLVEFLSGLMAAPVSVAAATICLREKALVEGIALRHIRLSPLNGAVALAIASGDLMRLVDLYYGGEGGEGAARLRLSPAEDRFLTRIANGLCGLLPAAWEKFATVAAELVDEDEGIGGSVAVQAFTVAIEGGAPVEIECRYPQSILQAVPALQSLDSDSSDGAWQERLMNCALSVPLPVRAVLAEPKLPLARLVNLRPGDIIPLSLPAQIDLTVAGLPFAGGTAGESNGRSAICIEHL